METLSLVWLVYFIDMLDSLRFPGIGCMFFVMLAVAGCMVVYWVAVSDLGWLGDEKEAASILTKKYLKFCKWWIPLLLVSASLNVIIPSKDTAYKMIAAYGVSEAYLAASESETVQRLAGKSLNIIESALDKYIAESEEAEE